MVKTLWPRNSEKVQTLAHNSDGWDNGWRRGGIARRRRSANPADHGLLLSRLHNSALDR
jgi:hypothetical protein